MQVNYILLPRNCPEARKTIHNFNYKFGFFLLIPLYWKDGQFKKINLKIENILDSLRVEECKADIIFQNIE